jgi:hypothetical protein
LRKKLIVIGGALLVIGFVVFWLGYVRSMYYNSTIGQIEQAFSNSAKQWALIVLGATLAGGIMAVSGLVTCIYGAVSHDEPTSELG